MIETITPAVCGSRRRKNLALAGFALGAVLAAASVGALLGLAGGLVAAGWVVFAAAGLALLAAAREAGLLRLPLPQSRRQVPESWRAELPLPVWSFGYGAGLGTGFATFQPVSTFWVACAAALALARPLPAALCFSLYGVGRALTVAWPRRDPSLAVEQLARRRRTLLRANAAALAGGAALLAAAPAAGAPVTLGPGLDPSVSGGVLARGQLDAGVSSVVVQPPGEPPIQIGGASSPSVDGDLVAYVDAEGIRVVNWRTGEVAAQVPGSVSKPALDWPLLAFRRDDAASKLLVLLDLSTGTERPVTSVGTKNDLGRPSLQGGLLAWHKATARETRVVLLDLAANTRRIVAKSRIALMANPALSGGRILWIEQRSGISRLRVRGLARTRARTLWSTRGRDRLLWTTALEGRTAYVTRWSLKTGRATLLQLQF